jgi:hypothetical protein
MLRSTKAIIGYRLLAMDGDIGRCKDLLFDEQHWTVRYIVADTGAWISKRLVIIAQTLLGEPDWNRREIPVRLTREQIEEAPSLDSDAPVSRRYEKKWLQLFQQPLYWQPLEPGAPSVVAGLGVLSKADKKKAEAAAKRTDDTTFLRSTAEVSGYRIHASDGEIGHVEEFIVDDATWSVRYMVVDTRNWLPGKKVLISPEWIRQVSWPETEVTVTFTTEEVKTSPKYDPEAPVNREYEIRLYDYYGRPHYWRKR